MTSRDERVGCLSALCYEYCFIASTRPVAQMVRLGSPLGNPALPKESLHGRVRESHSPGQRQPVQFRHTPKEEQECTGPLLIGFAESLHDVPSAIQGILNAHD